VGAVFVDQVRVSGALTQLREDARGASSAPHMTPVGTLYEQGSAGVASIAELSRAIDDLGDTISLHLGFSAAAAASVANRAAVADGIGPS
jgi:hypothetical protein